MKINKIWVPLGALPRTPWPTENWFFPNLPKAPTNSIQTGKPWVHSRCVLLSSQGGWLVSLETPPPPPNAHSIAAIVSPNFGPKYLSRVATKWLIGDDTLAQHWFYESLIFSHKHDLHFGVSEKRSKNQLSLFKYLTYPKVSFVVK